jgi:predicted nucleotide-binding protein (sugar kinase/HSP70/actin superfamily)
VGDGKTRFIGLDAAEEVRFSASRDESTRCHFCRNDCQRTFIDIERPVSQFPNSPIHQSTNSSPNYKSHRYIIATCEKGLAEDVKEVQSIKKKMDQLKKMYPDLSETAAKEVFNSRSAECEVLNAEFKLRNPQSAIRNIKIGFPRTLNMYSVAPFFIAYFESIGVPYKNIVFSDYTDDKMYREGSRRGAIDSCFPSKVALSHIHNLLFAKGARPDVVFFPILLTLPSELKYTVDSATCPTVAATPEVVKAAFTKEEDLFLKHGVRFLNPHLSMGEPALFERQMYALGSKLFGLDKKENREAMDSGYRDLRDHADSLRQKGRDILRRIEQEGKVGLVVLGRPYHNDPGLNHDILSEIQKYGYPIFTIDSLPLDADLLENLFGPEIRSGEIRDPLEIADVWESSYSENTNKKLWGAKYVARHPNLVAVDLSNFRCGHDAPVYSVVEEILTATGTPYFTFHDIDENKPSGSIKIRTETIHYFLQRYEEELKKVTVSC